MEIGKSITFWSVLLSVVCYFLGAALCSLKGLHPRLDATARGIWTSGCLLGLGHVLSAFHFYHDWSHGAAHQSTAQQTEELLGFSWGGGIYFNYVFTIAWLADTGWWWVKPESHRQRPRLLNVVLHSFLLFIVFNATVVFGEGFTRWLGLFGTSSLIILWWIARGESLSKPWLSARLLL